MIIDAADCEAVLQRALEAGGAPPRGQVTLTLSADAELATLDREHLGVDGPTDVLSFPLLPPEAFPPHPGKLDGTDGSTASVDGDAPLLLGDIVISVERAVEQAEAGRGGQTSDVRWTPAEELRLLITHGALHLCGWDHAEETERTAMRALEAELLGIDIPR